LFWAFPTDSLAAMVRTIPFGVLEKARINYDYAKK
jgi:hypothetical protein